MTESALRRHVVRMLLPLGAFVVEGATLPGVPDLCTTQGWIELKVAKLTNKHTLALGLRRSQALWMRRWIAVGGVCWLLLMVSPEHELLLLRAEDAVECAQREHLDYLHSIAIGAWRWHEYDEAALAEQLINRIRSLH